MWRPTLIINLLGHSDLEQEANLFPEGTAKHEKIKCFRHKRKLLNNEAIFAYRWHDKQRKWFLANTKKSWEVSFFYHNICITVAMTRQWFNLISFLTALKGAPSAEQNVWNSKKKLLVKHKSKNRISSILKLYASMR